MCLCGRPTFLQVSCSGNYEPKFTFMFAKAFVTPKMERATVPNRQSTKANIGVSEKTDTIIKSRDLCLTHVVLSTVVVPRTVTMSRDYH